MIGSGSNEGEVFPVVLVILVLLLGISDDSSAGGD